jgi:hypothetical protein
MFFYCFDRVFSATNNAARQEVVRVYFREFEVWGNEPDSLCCWGRGGGGGGGEDEGWCKRRLLQRLRRGQLKTDGRFYMVGVQDALKM